MEIAVENKYKKVNGVLVNNIDIRNEQLRRNLGKYSQYEETLAPAIGELYDINYNRSLTDITKGKSLLDYTQGVDDEYGRYINDRYFGFGEKKEVAGFDDHILRENLKKWHGKYPNYISYLDEVLGEDAYSRHVRYVNDFLSGQFIENALRQTEVGAVRNINVAVAKQGVITTNTNNMSGKDTQLGTITNYMYASSLYNGAIFNSDRHSERKYLTPTLINQYGNNLANVMELGDMLRVGVNDYDIKEDLSADAYIIDNLNSGLKGSLNLKYITDNVDKANRYVGDHFDGYEGYYEIGKDGYVGLAYDNRRNISVDTSKWDNVDKFAYSDKRTRSRKQLGVYADPDVVGGKGVISNKTEQSSQFDGYTEIGYNTNNGEIVSTGKTLLEKTARLFNENKISTLIGRFHTTLENGLTNEREFTDTAKSKFGNSHGRNLLTREAQETGIGDTSAGVGNGYDNPYCRTWTYHHQYNQVKKLIRPFMTDDGNVMSITDVQNRLGRYRSRYKLDDKSEVYGGNYLGENTVLNNNNGFVNICPSNDTDNSVDIKKCMFSIENLAWKDVNKSETYNYISKEQKGPNGGRIIWFPPYDLSFQESVDVDWESNTFIGRGEKVYTYKNTDRTGTLLFTMLIDHPSIVNSFSKLSDSDGGEGYSVSNDIDADILRFFAGCDIPEISQEQGKEKEKDDEKPKQDEELDTKSGSFSFDVYFPNNYSGTFSKDRGVTKVDESLSDNDWWTYLLFGNNGRCFNDKNKWIGYEVSNEGENHGISGSYGVDPHSDEIRESWIPVCQSWAEGDDQIGVVCTKDYKESSKEGIGDFVYKHRVDKDLRQYLKFPINYNDTTSYHLNSKNDSISKSDSEYTFAEVVCALLKSGKLNWVYYDTTTSTDAINFLINNGAVSDKVDKLAELFSNGNVTYESITYKGSATSNDPKNSDMLAKRRAKSVSRLFKETILEKATDVDERVEGSEAISKEGQSAQSISSLDDKKQRSVHVTVSYKYPDTLTKWEDNSAAATTPSDNTESGETSEFDEWYNELLYNSPIVKRYDQMFDKTFKMDVKQICKENNLSTNVSDYHADNTKWQTAINYILAIYGNERDRDDSKYLQFAALSGGTNNGDKWSVYCEKLWESDIYGDLTEYYNSNFENLTGYDASNTIPVPSDILALKEYIGDGADQTIFNGITDVTYNILKKEIDTLIFNRYLSEISDGFEGACDEMMNGTVLNDDRFFVVISSAFTGNYQCNTGEINFTEDETWKLPMYFYTNYYYTNIDDVIDENFDIYRQMNYLYTEIYNGQNIDENLEVINRIFKGYTAPIVTKDEHMEENLRNSICYVRSILVAANKQEAEVLIFKEKMRLKNIAKEYTEDIENNPSQIIQEKSDLNDKQQEAVDYINNKRNNIYQKFNGTLVTRYDTEADYFMKLEKDDPLVFKSIKDKFNYFNPAFHSMSPEGFNARLNFLQQCTRQGNTVESGREGSSTGANNLAFGRMPVCVLRIGDFINTRIIIRNMQIQYDVNNGMQWDLNPEGIGVQPMFAKISLGITLLGGQSLEGPISRLQNAITFDYYANTGVYDDRADRVRYNGKEQVYTRVFVAENENNTKGSDSITNDQKTVDEAAKS